MGCSGDRRGDARGRGEVGAEVVGGHGGEGDQETAFVPGIRLGVEEAGFDQSSGGVEGGGLGQAGRHRQAGLMDLAAFQAGGLELQHQAPFGVAGVEAQILPPQPAGGDDGSDALRGCR